MKVCDIMSDQVISIGRDEPVTAAARLLRSSNVGALPVCDNQGRLRGIVTDRDIVIRCVAAWADPAKTAVSEIMSRGVVTASPFDEVETAAKTMAGDQVRRLPVVKEGRLVGLLSLCDMAVDGNCDMEASAALAEISSSFRRK